MPEYFYNATQAALEIGISYRTMRRRIEEGKIEAVRGDDGQYSIAQSEVERLKQAQSERPRPALSGQRETGHERPDYEQRIADLERRVRTLEDAARRNQPTLAPGRQVSSSHPSTPSHLARNRATEAPHDMLSVVDFATKIGMEYTVLDGYIRRGVRSEKIDVTEVPTSRKGYFIRYFTPEQQQKAIELLRRHKKI